MKRAPVIPGREPYAAAASTLIHESGCTIRRYRKKSTGVAYTDDDDWGIEVPEPRGPVSFATFAHEVGHQLLHRIGRGPRWLHECEAWEYALAQFDRFGLPGVDRAEADAARCLVHAANKAVRRPTGRQVARLIRDRYPSWVWDHVAWEEVKVP